MRPFEALLLGALLLTLLAWSAQRLRARLWLRLLASGTSLVALTQAAVEGPRWQVVPAYVLALVLFALALRQPAAMAGQRLWRHGLRRLAAIRGWVRFRTDRPRAGV